MTPDEWGRLTPPQQAAFIAQHGPPPPGYRRQASAYQPATAPVPPTVTPPSRPKMSRKGLWVGVAVVVGLLVVGGIGNSGKSNTATNAARPTAAADAAPAVQHTAAPAAAAGPATQFDDGTYQVGVDVAAGRYKTPGPTDSLIHNCYWQRTKDDSGQFESIIANGNTQGPGSVTLRAGEFFQTSGGCHWAKQ